MDRESEQLDWKWLPNKMPGVTRLVQEKREAWGNRHVNLCFRRGVMERQPGWFFAREGALAVGTPWDHPALANFAALNVTSSQSLVVMREPGDADGTD